MKHWINKNYKTLIIGAFLVPIITVAIVSISHVTKWYGISNPVTWSIYLSIGIEIAALSALAAISADMGKKVYFPFAIVTLVQFIGNIFFAYSYIDLNSQLFKDWVDLVSPLVSFMGVEEGDFVGHKRFLALFAGGMLPLISLSFLHMLVKFTEEDRKKENELKDNQVVEDKEPENKIEASDLVGEVSRIRLSEDDLKKLEEVLLNPPPPNENLINAAKKYKEEKLKSASLKEEWALNDEEILKRAEQIQLKRVFEQSNKIKEQREEEFGPDDVDDEPTALANSQYRESDTNDEVSIVNEEIVNDTPTSVEEKTIELKQVVFEPIPEVNEEKIMTQTEWNLERDKMAEEREKRKEALIELMKMDQELGLYDEPYDNPLINDEPEREFFVNDDMEVNEITPALSDEEVREMFMDEWERKFDLVEDEDFSTTEPTEEEEEKNFSTIEPNSENIFQDEQSTDLNEEVEKKNP